MTLSAPKTYKNPRSKGELSTLVCDRSQLRLKLSYRYWSWMILLITGGLSVILGLLAYGHTQAKQQIQSSREFISCAHYQTGDPPSCRLVVQQEMQSYKVFPLKRQQPAQVVKVGKNQAYLKLKPSESKSLYHYGNSPFLTIAEAEEQAQRINRFTLPKSVDLPFELRQEQVVSLPGQPHSLWLWLGVAAPMLLGLALVQYIGFAEVWRFDRVSGRFGIQPQGFFPVKSLEFANHAVTEIRLATEYPAANQPNAGYVYNVHIFTIDGVWLRQGNTRGRIIFGFTQLSEAEQFAQALRYYLGLAGSSE